MPGKRRGGGRRKSGSNDSKPAESHDAKPTTTTTLRTPSAFDSNLLQLPPSSRGFKISLNDHAGKRVAMAALNLRDPDLVAAGELLAKRREKAHARDAKPNDLFTLGPVTSHRKSAPCGGAALAACARYIRDMADVAVDCRRWLSKTRASARGPRCLRWRNAANRSCAARLCSMRPPACRCPWCRGAQRYSGLPSPSCP